MRPLCLIEWPHWFLKFYNSVVVPKRLLGFFAEQRSWEYNCMSALGILIHGKQRSCTLNGGVHALVKRWTKLGFFFFLNITLCDKGEKVDCLIFWSGVKIFIIISKKFLGFTFFSRPFSGIRCTCSVAIRFHPLFSIFSHATFTFPDALLARKRQ